MRVVNMLEAKSILSRLVEAVETGAETEIIIARNGRSAARLVAMKPAQTGKRLGAAKGRFTVRDTIDADEAAVAALFTGPSSEATARHAHRALGDRR